MWFEWQMTEVEDLRMGALLYSLPLASGENAIMCYFVGGVSSRGGHTLFEVDSCRILPESVRVAESGVEMDIEPSQETDSERIGYMTALANITYDFIVRINSPRITDVRPCEDQSKINRKRARLGRAPLFSYHVVDLNKDIKSHLRQADNEGAGVRFHWRRGHFKACKNGLFWWNPHTAGRKVHGEIRKDYAA
jgi:hypothetical protein